MRKFLRPLLLVVALLFSQHAAMLHGLAHAEHDLAVASHQDDSSPALGHDIDVCAAFGALAHALGNATATRSSACVGVVTDFAAFEIVPASTRIVFDSRAPPVSA